MGYPIYHSQYTAAQIEASIGKTPRIKSSTRTWEIWDIATSAYVDTGVSIDTELYVDPTLTESGYAADAKVTGDKVSELKSDINNIDDALPYYETEDNITSTLTWVEGKFIDVTNGNITTYASLAYCQVGRVRVGDVFYLYGLRGMSNARAITIISNSGIVNDSCTVLSYYPSKTGYFSDYYTIPNDGILVITGNTSFINGIIVHKINKHYKELAVETDVETLQDAVSGLDAYIEYISPNIELIDYDNLTPGYINGQGGINSPSSTNLEKTSQKIPIVQGHTYTLHVEVPSATGQAWLAVGFWSGSDVFTGRESETGTTVDDNSIAELVVDSSIYSSTDSYFRVSWRSFGTQMATAKDLTFYNKTLIKVIETDLTGAEKAYYVTGNNVNLTKQNYDVKKLSFTPGESTGRNIQGIAIYGGVLFQGYGNGDIDLIDMSTGTTITAYEANGGHCGSLSFSNVKVSSDDEFPLLYVASYTEPKVFVYRISRETCALTKTYVIPETDGGYCQEAAYNPEDGTLWVLGHVNNSYASGGGWICSHWSFANETDNGDDTYTPSLIEKFNMPWIPYLQCIQCKNGQLFIVCGADGNTTADMYSRIFVLNMNSKIINAVIEQFPTGVRDAEPEGVDFVLDETVQKYNIILATRRLLGYYVINL